MLYIFHVDTGRMMTFEMNLALESVVQLKEVIERACRIPADKQVLLVSGGESLDPNARVCSYSAGADTNPIFLFSKCTIESMTPPTLSSEYASDARLKEHVEGSHSLPDTYTTVVTRVKLAQQFCDHARDLTRGCERLVHDQHLQQQGWAAVLANLEDSTSAFRARAELFQQNYNQYLGTRQDFIQLLQNFREDLSLLAKIPIVPALLEVIDSGSIKSDSSTTSGAGGKVLVRESEEEVQPKDPVTLLQWISAKDNQSSLQQVAEHCMRGLEQFDERVMDGLKSEVEQVLSAANKTGMKEIKGLEERLFGLEQLMFETKAIVQEQGDLAQSFLQNQTRANNLGDPSILPDLCASHRRQLQVMLNNHQHLVDIRNRCSRAKEELCHNLHMRLKWVMYVENGMCDVNSKLVIYHENLKRLRRHLEVVQQIHLAPQMYVTAVGEVVRRRTFSQAFLMWASDLACHFLAVHNEEVTRRRDFQSQFDGHFLNTLFPGMEDFPPPFATQAPSIFDSGLPKLSLEDIHLLKQELPELTFSLTLPDLESITQFFLIKSVAGTLKSESKEETSTLEDHIAKVVTESGLVGNLGPTLLQQIDSEKSLLSQAPSLVPIPVKGQDRGFESEIDTEEFEKLGQSPVELRFDSKQTAALTGHVTEAQMGDPSVIATLEENLGSTRNEVERVQNLLEAAGRVMREAVANLRDDLALLRSKTALERDEVLRLCRDLAAGLAGKQQEIVAGQVLRERELIQRLTVDHELEMVNLKQDTKVDIDAKDEKIKELKQCIEKKEQELATLRADMERRLEEEVRERREVARSFESQLYECRTLCGELQQQLDAADKEKVRELKDQCDKLTQDYKAEVESLRSRFRMALDCSPSDSSLEKIERSNLCAEKEAAVKTAIEQERARWQATLEQKIKIVKTRADAEKQVWFNEAMRRVVGEKDRQLDAARAREVSLIDECHRHQETIRRLTDEQGAGPMSLGAEPGDVLERLSNLESVNARLKTELAEEREKNSGCLPSMTADNASSDVKMSTTSSSDMSTSVAVVQEGVSRDVATSPEPIQQTLQEELEIKERLTRSQTSLINQGKISIVSCNAGDSVLVVWDENHRNYTILQEGNTLYFLHSDCLETMDLKPGCDGMPTRLYSTGEVINKEYCQAKKSENRYRVPKGTKFYRVKVRPLAKDSVLIRGHHHHHHHHHPQLSLLPFTAPSSLLGEAAK